jgi:uncharacterized protein (DUF362 family)
MSEVVEVLRFGEDTDAFDVSDASALIRQALERRSDSLGTGERVLIKPNFIKERHLLRDEHRQVITQREVIEPVLDWVTENLCPRLLKIADAPEGSADMPAILKRSGVSALASARGIGLDVEDLRLTKYIQRDGVPLRRLAQSGDSLGTVRVGLGESSSFFGHDGHRYYGADYDINETNDHHHGSVQEYLFSGTALGSDLVINIPKLKTHKKAGITVSLKNLVGLNGNKNWLPHHSLGTPAQRGDAYPDDSSVHRFEGRLLSLLKPVAHRSPVVSKVLRVLRKASIPVLGDTQETIRSGNWWGNDTIWRMILDLNRILLYARPDGTVATTPQRRTLSIVDGIVAGEGNGPDAPDAVDAGIVVVGQSFLAVDLVCARLMGFDWEKIPHLAHAFDKNELPLAEFTYDDIVVASCHEPWNKMLRDVSLDDCLRFRPHFGWVGHIEADR